MSRFNVGTDLLKLGRILWPKLRFYGKQLSIIESVCNNRKTICVAGNKLGKDFTAAFIALTFFLTRTPCRVVTTSVDGDQLEGVLWGEIRNFIQRSKYPLDSRLGGPLVINHLHIRKIGTSGSQKGVIDGLSYLRGRVAKKGEGLLGHHVTDSDIDDTAEQRNPLPTDGIPRTLFIADEASGVEDISFERASTWAERELYIGNPFDCQNAFRRESEQGDIVNPDYKDETDESKRRYYRKVIRITGHESPNVRLAKAEIAAGKIPSGRTLIPGVLPYSLYRQWVETWDEIRKSVSIDALFYKGKELLLFPHPNLELAHRVAAELRPKLMYRRAKSIGCDPGEGAAETAWYVIDDFGILDEFVLRTPNTAEIRKESLGLLRKWGLQPQQLMFDAGGGGKQIADAMRDDGYPVQTVRFSEPVSPRPKRGMTSIQNQIEEKEERYAYLNRRVEMYGRFSLALDPDFNPQGFGIPEKMVELRRQLALIPKKYDKEGRLWLPPKNKKDPNSKEQTLIDIIGCSPDRADALVVAFYCKDFGLKRSSAGAA